MDQFPVYVTLHVKKRMVTLYQMESKADSQNETGILQEEETTQKRDQQEPDSGLQFLMQFMSHRDPVCMVQISSPLCRDTVRAVFCYLRHRQHCYAAGSEQHLFKVIGGSLSPEIYKVYEVPHHNREPTARALIHRAVNSCVC